ncbi:SDR family NAD(P)-dependent oxidoreductase [soil metagenome]
MTENGGEIEKRRGSNPISSAINEVGEFIGRQSNRPTGILGRHSPFFFLNAVDRLRGETTLEAAVGGKVVMITGASSGIGEASAKRTAAAGARVLLVARTKEKLDDLAAGIEAEGGEAAVYQCDLTDTDAIAEMAARALDEQGEIDVLVNNAGRSIRRSVSLSYDRFHDYERTMQLNYFGAVRLILAVLPQMQERGEGQVVNVSSAGVPTRTPRFSAYVASKAALDAFTECIGPELLADGIRLTTIHMPLVRTPMIAPTGIYRSFPALTPAEAADRVAQAMIYKPRRIGTPFSEAALLASAVSPASIDAVRSAGYQLFPDSTAARGDEGEDAVVSRTGSAFARVLRGIHW